MSDLRPNLESCPANYARQSPWRQGNILSNECAVALNLASNEEPNRIFVVISHDCDLAERDLGKEPFAEVIEAFEIEKCDPNLTNSKSTRLLHIEAERNGRIQLELQAVTKRAVDKSVLELFDPMSDFSLLLDEGNTLSHWLAARYKRAAFPNSFLNRLGNKITEALSNAAKKEPHAILGIFLDHDPEYEIEDPKELYELWIYVVYLSERSDAEDIAKEIASNLKQRFERNFIGQNNTWGLVELRKCEPVADTSFSLYEAKRMKFFRLDHISLRQSPPAELPDIS